MAEKLVSVLLVEDDVSLADAIKTNLKLAYRIDVAGSFCDALRMLSNTDYKLLLIDVLLPDSNGVELCKYVRTVVGSGGLFAGGGQYYGGSDSTVGIIMLTALGGLDMKLKAYDVGADDYLTKPFNCAELKARMEAVLRRTVISVRSGPSQLCYRDLVVDTGSRLVVRANQKITLCKKEFELLCCLLEHAGTVVSRSSLIDKLWSDDDSVFDGTLNVHVKHLRNKVDVPFSERLIHTVHGVGYKIAVEGCG